MAERLYRQGVWPYQSDRSKGAEGNYTGILFWAIILGLAIKKLAGDHTKDALFDLSEAVSQAVRWIINLAPFGILGLVFNSVSTNGLSIFTDYGKLLLLLVGCMLAVALIVDPLIVAIVLKRNPYPLVFKCFKEKYFWWRVPEDERKIRFFIIRV